MRKITKITERGCELSGQILRFYESPRYKARSLVAQRKQELLRSHVREVCSLVARHATTHARLAETAVNRDLTPREERQDRAVEARIRELVASLPKPRGRAAIGVEFSGDPRGFTVKLVVPGDKGGNTWGLDGRYGI